MPQRTAPNLQTVAIWFPIPRIHHQTLTSMQCKFASISPSVPTKHYTSHTSLCTHLPSQGKPRYQPRSFHHITLRSSPGYTSTEADPRDTHHMTEFVPSIVISGLQPLGRQPIGTDLQALRALLAINALYSLRCVRTFVDDMNWEACVPSGGWA